MYAEEIDFDVFSLFFLFIKFVFNLYIEPVHC